MKAPLISLHVRVVDTKPGDGVRVKYGKRSVWIPDEELPGETEIWSTSTKGAEGTLVLPLSLAVSRKLLDPSDGIIEALAREYLNALDAARDANWDAHRLHLKAQRPTSGQAEWSAYREKHAESELADKRFRTADTALRRSLGYYKR